RVAFVSLNSLRPAFLNSLRASLSHTQNEQVEPLCRYAQRIRSPVPCRTRANRLEKLLSNIGLEPSRPPSRAIGSTAARGSSRALSKAFLWRTAWLVPKRGCDDCSA